MMTAEMQLSPDQQRAHDSVMDWFRTKKDSVLTLGGFAGTGKTTTMGTLARSVKNEVKKVSGRQAMIGFCCFTGKASLVLRIKLDAVGILDEDFDYCGTIHSMIYTPVFINGRISGWDLKESGDVPFDLIILDEASMVDEKMFEDLKSYGIPILAVGDHGQLPPIKGQMNLMENPQLRLEKIHRQAEDNPIIKLSMMVRETGHVPPGVYGDGIFKSRKRDLVDKIKAPLSTMVICGFNRTRSALNAKLRGIAGFSGDVPVVGERVICLKNNREAGIYNGMIGNLKAIDKAGSLWWNAKVDFPDANVEFQGRILREQFGCTKTFNEHPDLMFHQIGDLFDWGYAMTCHKAQGSENENVVVIEETYHMKTDDLKRRWLYTAYTRASKRLVIIGH